MIKYPTIFLLYPTIKYPDQVLRGQKPFRNTGLSLIKTSVMMIGEFEYDTIFNEEVIPVSAGIVNIKHLIVNILVITCFFFFY